MGRCRLLAAALITAISLLVAPGASAQSVQQSGTVTRNQLPVWITTGTIGPGGTSADSPISSIGATGNICSNSARQSSGAWIALCLGYLSGVPTITVQNFGSASAQPLQFIVNGTTYPFPGALAGITINGTSVTGGINNDCLIVSLSTVGQVACPIVTAPTTGSGSVVFNTSPTLIGSVGGNLTFPGNLSLSGNNTYSGQAIFTGTSFPSQSPGNTLLAGTAAPPTLTQTGQAYLFNTAANGAVLQGFGTLFDVVLANKAGTPVLEVPTGQTNVTIPNALTLSGLSSGTCTNGVGLNSSNQAITVACPGAASSIQVATTLVNSGSSGNIEFNNAGVLGELTPNGGVVKSSSNLQADGNYSGWALQNCTLAAAVAGNNLTVSLKDNGGNNPSATSPCNINFRNATAASGPTSLVQVTGATSFTANSGSTFGITNTAATCAAAASCPFRAWVVAFNNAGSVSLGVVALTNASGVLPLNEGVLTSATACNACTNATTLGTFYTTTTLTSLPFRILGYIEWGSGLASAGVYASGPTIIQTMGPGIRKPGDQVQRVANSTTTVGSTTSASLTALTNTQTLAISPTSTANPVRVTSSGTIGVNNSAVGAVQVQRGSTLVGPLMSCDAPNSSGACPNGIVFLDTPGTVSSTSYSYQGKVGGGNTVSYPLTGSSTYLELEEIMGALPDLIPDNDNDPRLLHMAG